MSGAAVCLVLCCLAAEATAAEPPPIPDPIGLGERLVLIEHLRDAYGQRPSPGASLDELRAAYAAAWQAKQQPARTATPDDELVDTGRPDRERRLRQRLLERYGVEADPAQDETALLAQLRRLDAERVARDQQAIAEMVAADRGRPAPAPGQVVAEPEPEPEPDAKPDSAAKPRPSTKPGVERLAFKANGVSDCWLAVQGESRCLLVAFGTDHNGAFGTIRQDAWERVSRSPYFTRSVLLLGHGRGTDVGGENIEVHLKTHKRFYETMGGTLPAAPIECLILASCAENNADQMRSMRDGLGYFPTWRVATGPRSAATGFSVIAAVTDIAQKPDRPAWRGLYRMGLSGDAVAAFGEVGMGGERAETTYWRLVKDEATGVYKTIGQK